MKRLSIIVSVLCLFLLVGCEKDKETEGISKTTYYVSFALNGEEAMTIPVGGTFTDPGYVCTENGKPSPVTVTGTVDPTTAGVYTIRYSATNSDGYTSVFYRYVGVVTPVAAANDFSGSYKRTNNGAVAVWKKLADGLYSNDNVGGVLGGQLYVYVFNVDGITIEVPKQETTSGTTSCDGEVYILSPASYSWVVVNSGYGASVRTFVKQ